MIVIGLDPGTNESTMVRFDGIQVAGVHSATNADVFAEFQATTKRDAVLVIEEFESYGMAVGREVFRTIRWAGNFEALWYPGRVEFLPRRIVKQHICHTTRATDANIRTELIDRFGGPQKAIGRKKEPGPLYGVKSHAWAALAVAVTWWDQNHDKPQEIRPGIVPDF